MGFSTARTDAQSAARISKRARFNGLGFGRPDGYRCGVTDEDQASQATAERPSATPSRWIGPALITALAVAPYLGSLHGAFVFDDASNIVDAPSVHALWPPGWLDGSSRPVVSLTFALCWVIGGGAVWPFHVFNIGVHAVNALLVAYLVRAALRLPRVPEAARAQAPAIALWAAALWSVHPLHTSAITYVVHRYESLSSLFYLAAVVAFVKLAQPAGRRALWLTVLCVGSALACWSKEIAVTIPLALAVVDAALVSKSLREAARKTAPVHLLAAAVCGLSLLAVAQPRDVNSSQGFALTMLRPLDYARSQLGVIGHYFRQIAWPSGLCIDYFDWPIARSIGAVMPAALVTLAALWATAVLLWRKPALGLGGAWFFLILAPTSTFLPLAGELVAERRLYLPLVGPAAIAAAALALWQTKHRVAATATGAVIVAALLATTAARNADYRTAASILGDNLSKRPGNARVRYNYGNALKDEGHIDRALGEYRECIRTDPGYMDCFANAVVAAAHLRVRDPFRGDDLLPEGAETNESKAAEALIARADRAMRSGLRPLAIAMLREATARNPRSDGAYARLAILLGLDPNPATRDGAAALEAALRAWALRGSVLDPMLGEALAAAYAEVGRFDDAIRVTLQLQANFAAAGMEAGARAQAAHADGYRRHERWTPIR